MAGFARGGEPERRVRGRRVPAGASGLEHVGSGGWAEGRVPGAARGLGRRDGVAGAGLSTTVIIALGVANVLADGFSMAASNYSGTKTELDELARLREVEARHIRLAPEGEREEVRQILAGKGLSGEVLHAATDAICEDRERWIDMMLVEEYGLAPVAPHPFRSALVTFVAFILAGFVPLVPFLLGMAGGFWLASVITAGVFFAIGAGKSLWSLAPWWRSGLETLAIGGTAAAIAFFVGSLFHA